MWAASIVMEVTLPFWVFNLDEPQQMVRKACQRAIDENIASLQKNFDQFKVNTPLISVSPPESLYWLERGSH